MMQQLEVVLMVIGLVLYFSFSDGNEFYLRPIFMAGEDRVDIINLLEETFNRMALAASIQLRQDVTA